MVIATADIVKISTSVGGIQDKAEPPFVLNGGNIDKFTPAQLSYYAHADKWPDGTLISEPEKERMKALARRSRDRSTNMDELLKMQKAAKKVVEEESLPKGAGTASREDALKAIRLANSELYGGDVDYANRPLPKNIQPQVIKRQKRDGD